MFLATIVCQTSGCDDVEHPETRPTVGNRIYFQKKFSIDHICTLEFRYMHICLVVIRRNQQKSSKFWKKLNPEDSNKLVQHLKNIKSGPALSHYKVLFANIFAVSSIMR